jgi:hypothetical protein
MRPPSTPSRAGADGGMRDAESTLDQLISFCGDKIEEPTCSPCSAWRPKVSF